MSGKGAQIEKDKHDVQKMSRELSCVPAVSFSFLELKLVLQIVQRPKDSNEIEYSAFSVLFLSERRIETRASQTQTRTCDFSQHLDELQLLNLISTIDCITII